jgi:hypothetical protein
LYSLLKSLGRFSFLVIIGFLNNDFEMKFFH